MKKLRIVVVVTALVAVVAGVWFFGFRKPSAVNNPVADNVEREIVNNTESETGEVPDVVNDIDVEDSEDDDKDEDSPLPVTSIDNAIPFTAQAATGEWSDDHQQDACEEASALMAMWWVKGGAATSKQEARSQILAITSFEEKNYGSSNDTDADDTVKRIFNEYFSYNKVEVVRDINVDDIIQALMKSNVVIVPADGQALGNPNFTAPGPERHMLLIRGYDAQTKEFITNDPGTRRGEAYRYKPDTLFNAIREYPTGDHEPIAGKKKVMIVISR